MTIPFETHTVGRKRNSCKGMIIMNEKLLLTVNRDDEGIFYLLPGGGQKFGETLPDALIREVLEETGWLVEPGRLVLVRDYIGANHEFAGWESDVHQTEFVFTASPVRKPEDPPENEDAWQTGIEWVSLSRLETLRMYPSMLPSVIPALTSGNYDGPIYVGDVN